MLKLINILSELQVTPQGITPEKVYKYYLDNIGNNKNINYNYGWQEYKKICKPYCEKYNIHNHLNHLDEFKKLSKHELAKMYNKMREIVKNVP